MFCDKCGKQLPDGSKFCTGCGKNVTRPTPVQPVSTQQPRPVRKAKPQKDWKELLKKPWVALVAGVLCGALVVGLIAGVAGGATAGKREGAGYGSAEDAALAYVQAMKAGDVKRMAAAFAVESYVDHYDAEAYVGRINYYAPNLPQPIDPVNDYFRDMKIGIREGQIYDIIESQYLYFTGITDNFDGRAVSIKDGEQFEEADELVRYFTQTGWPKSCANMQIGKVRDGDYCIDMEIISVSEEVYEDNLEDFAKIYGCDKLEEVAIELTLNREDYLMVLRMGRYDGKWFVVDTSGTLGAILGIPATYCGCIEKDEVF